MHLRDCNMMPRLCVSELGATSWLHECVAMQAYRHVGIQKNRS